MPLCIHLFMLSFLLFTKLEKWTNHNSLALNCIRLYRHIWPRQREHNTKKTRSLELGECVCVLVPLYLTSCCGYAPKPCVRKIRTVPHVSQRCDALPCVKPRHSLHAPFCNDDFFFCLCATTDVQHFRSFLRPYAPIF